ncbi:hypothetical protein DFH07DRAFT_808056 [Mycena maculata]|uniref:Uncharacterized protein n=1 Tax=Mycena maculata TaxID=230809 RepID=A0AAD7NNQ1_9AGAR|nr:hypothetical protein DFH07DRAFT_808056 [Mycena maculata]
MTFAYSYENARFGHLPKHWSTAERRVCAWQPFLRHPHSLENVLGTYVFVSLLDEGRPEMRLGPENPGFLTLELPRDASGSPAWDNVHGSFQAENDWRRGAFTGLMPHGMAEATLTSSRRPNLRRFDLSTSYNNRVPLKGHALDVLDAVDDNGNNYIVMMLEYFVVGSNCFSYMAKKQLAPGDRVGLTDSECTKLGISSTYEEVERAANELQRE